MTLKVQAGAAQPVALMPIEPLGDHACQTINTTLTEPTRPAGVVRGILVQAETENIRFTLGCTSAPSTTCGFVIVADDPPMLIPIGPSVCPKFIGVAAGARLNWQWVA